MPIKYSYIFVWDKVKEKVIASYYEKGKSLKEMNGEYVWADERAPDTSDGPLDRALDPEFSVLNKYLTDAYIIGNGTADTLDGAVKYFFGMEHDVDHAF